MYMYIVSSLMKKQLIISHYWDQKSMIVKPIYSLVKRHQNLWIWIDILFWVWSVAFFDWCEVWVLKTSTSTCTWCRSTCVHRANTFWAVRVLFCATYAVFSSPELKGQQAFLITCRLLVDFSHFIFSRTTGIISTKLGTNILGWKGIQVCSSKGPALF